MDDMKLVTTNPIVTRHKEKEDHPINNITKVINDKKIL